MHSREGCDSRVFVGLVSFGSIPPRELALTLDEVMLKVVSSLPTFLHKYGGMV